MAAVDGLAQQVRDAAAAVAVVLVNIVSSRISQPVLVPVSILPLGRPGVAVPPTLEVVLGSTRYSTIYQRSKLRAVQVEV